MEERGLVRCERKRVCLDMVIVMVIEVINLILGHGKVVSDPCMKPS